MKRLPAAWTPHTVTVRPYAGEGMDGASYDDPVTLAPESGTGVYVEDVQEMVTDASGKEVLSSGRVHLSFQDCPVLGSLVTVWPGTEYEREAPVIKSARHSHPSWPGYAIAYLR